MISQNQTILKLQYMRRIILNRLHKLTEIQNKFQKINKNKKKLFFHIELILLID